MKTDDDSYVRINNMVEGLRHQELYAHKTPPNISSLYIGAPCNTDQVRRKVGDRWYVPFELYPNETFPPYAAGGGYVLTQNLVQCIAGAHLSKPNTTNPGIWPIEDAYTGELVKQCGGNIVQHNFLIELAALNGRDLLYPEDVFSVMTY